ncbi:hypothetical protein AB1E18_012021 [Capra hircus]
MGCGPGSGPGGVPGAGRGRVVGIRYIWAVGGVGAGVGAGGVAEVGRFSLAGAGSKPGPCPPAATSRSAGPGAAPVAAPAGSPGPWRTWRRRLQAPAWAACERGTVGGTRCGAAGTMPFLPEAGAAGRAVALALVLLLPAMPTGAGALLRLQPGMPHVCAEQELTLVGRRQPCVRAFSRTVPVWRPGCGRQAWCVSHERRTIYYTGYRQVYSTEAQTVFRCCPGWSQQPGSQGCLSPVCSPSLCFNGGHCVSGSAQPCRCPPGFQGPRCQHGEWCPLQMLGSRPRTLDHHCSKPQSGLHVDLEPEHLCGLDRGDSTPR